MSRCGEIEFVILNQQFTQSTIQWRLNVYHYYFANYYHEARDVRQTFNFARWGRVILGR